MVSNLINRPDDLLIRPDDLSTWLLTEFSSRQQVNVGSTFGAVSTAVVVCLNLVRYCKMLL